MCTRSAIHTGQGLKKNMPGPRRDSNLRPLELLAPMRFLLSDAGQVAFEVRAMFRKLSLVPSISVVSYHNHEICCVGGNVLNGEEECLCRWYSECIIHTGQGLKKYDWPRRGFEPTTFWNSKPQLLLPTELRPGQVGSTVFAIFRKLTSSSVSDISV